MTKATPAPHSPGSPDQDGAPSAAHKLFQAGLAATDDGEDGDDSSARASDNGGGTSGNHAKGTPG